MVLRSDAQRMAEALPRQSRLPYMRAVQYEKSTGHTFRSPSRDTQPAQLIQLAVKFDAGYIPRGDTDQMSMFEAPEFRKCPVCSAMTAAIYIRVSASKVENQRAG